MPKNWSVKSDNVSKWVICTCVESFDWRLHSIAQVALEL